MKARHLILTVLSALGLSGCFTSDESLIADADAVAPYETITFAEAGSPEDRTVLKREGKAYVTDTDDGSLAIRFKPAGDDLYLVEVAGEEDGKIQRLYALLKLDRANGLATTYKAIAEPEKDAGPGLAACEREDMDMICIEDADAYVALARAALDAGAEAQGTYKVTLE